MQYLDEACAGTDEYQGNCDDDGGRYGQDDGVVSEPLGTWPHELRLVEGQRAPVAVVEVVDFVERRSDHYQQDRVSDKEVPGIVGSPEFIALSVLTMRAPDPP